MSEHLKSTRGKRFDKEKSPLLSSTPLLLLGGIVLTTGG
jgi:hypothetical protein